MTDPLAGSDTYELLGGQKPPGDPRTLVDRLRFPIYTVACVPASGGSENTSVLDAASAVAAMNEAADEIERLRSLAGAASPGQSFADIRATLPQADPHPQR